MPDGPGERLAKPNDQLTWVGKAVSRLEDERLLRGIGHFVDDFDLANMLHMAVGRCPYPHARVLSINVDAARKLDGVVSILTGRQVAERSSPLTVLRPLPGVPALPFFAMAVEVALYEGHPVVSVVATERSVAEDAIDLITIEYEPLPHIVDAEVALATDAPKLWSVLDSNLVVENVRARGDVDQAFASAQTVISDRFAINRVTALPMEGRAVLASYTPGLRHLEVIAATQIPHLQRLQLAQVLGLPEASIRMMAPDIGGGFGLKLGVYPEDVCVCLHSLELGRPVKWVEDRMEHFRASTHAREAVHQAQLAVDENGRLTGIRDEYLIDMGAYNSSFGSPMLSSLMLPGPYRILNCDIVRRLVTTNKTPVGAYRGYGQPESNFVREILVDRAARATGHDPVEFRRQNLITPDAMPWESPSGAVYDSGDYGRTLDAAIKRIGYEELRRQQPALRRHGRLVGVGVASFVEMTGYPGSRFLGKHHAAYGAHESVTIRANRSGGVDLYTGVSSFGQGTETAFAQVCASVLGIRPEQVVVHAGDTVGTPYNTGGFASRTTIAGTGAILAAGDDVRTKALRIAAYLLEVGVDDLNLADGVFRVAGVEARSVTLAEVAAEAISGHHLPPGESPGLESTKYFDPPASAFGNGTAAAIVEVDRETGCFDVQRFVLAHDCGQQINPLLVEGQLHGGLAQGFGAAFFEELRYDPDSGQLLNGTMVDYLMPTAADLPDFELEHVDVPSPVTPLGVRGVGEAGTIPPAAAVANAICDALMPARVEINRLPLTGEAVWQAIEAAQRRSPWGSEDR